MIVANPRNLPMISSNIRKSDKVDAHLLARLARVDPQLLSPVTHRGKAHYPAIAQLRARDLLVRARTRLINAVRGISKTVGLRIPTCSSPSFPEKATSCLSEELKPSLAPLLETISHLSKQIYCNTVPLADNHRHALDGVLANREGSKISILTWLRQPPGAPKPKHILVHLERLKTLRKLLLPDGLEHIVHQNRLLKLAREGGQMTAQHLGDLELERRHATLVAMLLDTRATLIDEIIDQHDRFMGTQFSKAKRNHADRFQQSGKAINDKVRLYSRIGRALLDAKQSGADSVCRHRSDHPLGGVQQKHH